MRAGEETETFRHAIEAIDAANASDPTRITHRGTARPKELVHGELATDWVHRLRDDPSEALLLAARAHHLRRWQLPRSEYPEGRAGYHAWRRELQQRHAEEAARILSSVGYGPEMLERVGELIRKRGLGNDDEVQTLEDALCLVFLETQLEDFARRHDDDKVVDILRKSMRKMSAEALRVAAEIGLSEDASVLLGRAAETLRSGESD